MLWPWGIYPAVQNSLGTPMLYIALIICNTNTVMHHWEYIYGNNRKWNNTLKVTFEWQNIKNSLLNSFEPFKNKCMWNGKCCNIWWHVIEITAFGMKFYIWYVCMRLVMIIHCSTILVPVTSNNTVRSFNALFSMVKISPGVMNQLYRLIPNLNLLTW